MPKTGEKARKLKLLKEGKGVRPPKRWFDIIRKEVREEYPKVGQKRQGRIVGGIWAKMSRKSKEKIVKKYQK